MITTTLINTESTQNDRSHGTVSTVVIGISVLLLGSVVSVVAINGLAPVVWQLADIVVSLSQQG